MRVVQLAAILTISLLVFLAHMAITSHQPVEIRVRPQALLEGSAFWLTCRVEKDDRNRLLDYGVVNYREHSQRQLDGSQAPITFQALIEQVPCDAGPAYCQVHRLDGSIARAIQPITVAGCDP